jgi:hypothetical protein
VDGLGGVLRYQRDKESTTRLGNCCQFLASVPSKSHGTDVGTNTGTRKLYGHGGESTFLEGIKALRKL